MVIGTMYGTSYHEWKYLSDTTHGSGIVGAAETGDTSAADMGVIVGQIAGHLSEEEIAILIARNDLDGDNFLNPDGGSYIHVY